MESVWDYFSKIIPESVLIKLQDFLNREDFDVYNTKNLKDFEILYRQSMYLGFRVEIRKKIISDFQFSFYIKDHFISRLIARFKDKSIDFIMNDIRVAYNSRNHKNYAKSKTLKGEQLKIIYNRENNEVVSAFTPKRLNLRRQRRLDQLEKVYNCENLPNFITKSIYLAGTNAKNFVGSRLVNWRESVISMLEDFGYDGVVIIPEDNPDGSYKFPNSIEEKDRYLKQIEWEQKCLNSADAIIFWLPRSIPDNIGLASNFELAEYIDSGKIFVGSYPTDKDTDTDRNNYFKAIFKLKNISWYTRLDDCVRDEIGRAHV